METDIIPAEQYKRLLVKTDNRGRVTSANVVDESLLYRWIEIGILEPECMDYTTTLMNWRRRCYGFLDAKIVNFNNSLGDDGNAREYYTELMRLANKRDLADIEEFTGAHRSDWPVFWPRRYDIQKAYGNIIKLIDSIRAS